MTDGDFGRVEISGMELDATVLSGVELQEKVISTVDDQQWDWDSPPALFLWLAGEPVLMLIVAIKGVQPQAWLPALAESGLVQQLVKDYGSPSIRGVALYAEGVIQVRSGEATDPGEPGDEIRIVQTLTDDFKGFATLVRDKGGWHRHDTRGPGGVQLALNEFFVLVSAK